MDSGMEDSGFDSDHKSQNGILDGAVAETSTENHTQPGDLGKSSSYKALKKTSELQKKIERQRDLARKSKTIDQQPKRGSHLLSRSRLSVPPVGTNRAKEVEFSPSGLSDQCQPLVTIVSDESEEDEFDMPRFPRATQKEITEQLIKDGYNLDLEPDDEDLDLIPPRPLNERCTCCQMHNNCSVQ
ncbi:protein FAM219A-like isoform X2 [Littorina saxatilis]|uniref:Protein FAM219A n=1 Tax=Littorina saxatilis TaxID=31220 RepID=A0AAN9GP83_9CAEN